MNVKSAYCLLLREVIGSHVQMCVFVCFHLERGSGRTCSSFSHNHSSSANSSSSSQAPATKAARSLRRQSKHLVMYLLWRWVERKLGYSEYILLFCFWRSNCFTNICAWAWSTLHQPGCCWCTTCFIPIHITFILLSTFPFKRLFASESHHPCLPCCLKNTLLNPLMHLGDWVLLRSHF